MKKLLKLPLRIAALPLIVLLLAFQLIGSIAGSIADAPDSMIYQTVGLGVFFALAPHIASWLLDKVTSLVLVILDFLLT